MNYLLDYYNEIQKEHIIPISKEIAALILVQEQRVADDFDNGCEYLLPRKSFLNEHEEHLDRTNEILNRAKQNQWQRQIETNERVKNRLE